VLKTFGFDLYSVCSPLPICILLIFCYRGMQFTENLMSVSYEDFVITYGHIMYIVQYIRDRDSGFFLEHAVSLGKWFPLF